jgi:hypothetical protein
MIASETTRVGDYIVGWHEGTLAIMTVDDFIELQEFDDSKTMYPVNSIYDVKEALCEFEKDYGFKFSSEEKHDIITFGCLSSIFQDMSMPFKWKDVLIFRGR